MLGIQRGLGVFWISLCHDHGAPKTNFTNLQVNGLIGFDL